jgi:hypothetical protein
VRVAVAVVAALVAHAFVIVWLAPERDPVSELAAPEPSATEPVVEIVLLDERAPDPVANVATPAAPHTPGKPANSIAKRDARTARAAGNPAVATTSDPTVGDAPVAAPPARGYFAMRRVDLSPAHIVDRVPERSMTAAPVAAGDGELRPSGRGTYTTDLGGSNWRDRTATAHVARDGTVRFDNAPDFDIHFAGLGVAGKFNVDDWLARRAGIDPYASAKRAYLDRTRDARARIAEVNRADDLAHAQRALLRNVEAVRAIADPAARKQALFELWDDVAETGDDALVRAGAGARAYLVGAIRAMRPALAFTPAELAQLNAHRHSRAVFAPYE